MSDCLTPWALPLCIPPVTLSDCSPFSTQSVMRVSLLFSLALFACSALHAVAVPSIPVFPLVTLTHTTLRTHSTHCGTAHCSSVASSISNLPALCTPSCWVLCLQSVATIVAHMCLCCLLLLLVLLRSGLVGQRDHDDGASCGHADWRRRVVVADVSRGTGQQHDQLLGIRTELRGGLDQSGHTADLQMQTQAHTGKSMEMLSRLLIL